MVSDVLPPSRAATLTLVGGELALDFANTSSGRGSAGPLEHLQAPATSSTGRSMRCVLPPEDAQWLKGEAARERRARRRSAAGRRSTFARTFIRSARELAAGRAAPPEAIDHIRALHARCLEKARLAPFGGRFAWNWRAQGAPIEAVLGPISLSAMTTLLQADLTRIKQCQGEKCGWLFLDTTKNKSRRWCEMEVCGNRAKQKRLAGRARGG